MSKNGFLSKKQKCWPKIAIFSKKENFWQKMNFLSKNWKFVQKCKLKSKVEILKKKSYRVPFVAVGPHYLFQWIGTSLKFEFDFELFLDLKYFLHFFLLLNTEGQLRPAQPVDPKTAFCTFLLFDTFPSASFLVGLVDIYLENCKTKLQ
mgnify:CR=1 FL=1